MKTNVIVGLVFACALASASSVRAQQAAKDVEGTVTSVDPTYMWVKPEKGESVMVMIDAKTTITRDKKKISTKEVKTGEHATAHGPENQGMIMAQAIEVGAPAKNAKK